MDAGYNEITEWELFVGIFAMSIHEMMMIKWEAIGKLKIIHLCPSCM